MQHVWWTIFGFVCGHWSCSRARHDIRHQRRIGNTFGEAHLADSRLVNVVVSAMCGGTFLLVSFDATSMWMLLSLMACVATGFRVSLIDIDTHTIPQRIMVKASALLLLMLFIASLTDDAVHLSTAVLGGAVSWCFMRLIEALSRGDLGHADVVFAGYLGLILGARGLHRIPIALLTAFVFAGLVALVMIAMTRATRTSHIPFGPFLFVGMVVAVLR